MLLIIENDNDLLLEERCRFFKRFAMSTWGAGFNDYENAFEKFPIDAVYVPRVAQAEDPIGFCRALKQSHPNVPLVTPIKREECTIDLDALYTVTDNIPIYPLTFVQMGEIICELQRMYTGRDFLEPVYRSLRMSIYTTTAIYNMTTFSVNTNESAILRHLWVSMPRHVSLDEMALISCRPDRHHNEFHVKVLIDGINRRARTISGHDVILFDEERNAYLGPSY